MMAIQYSFQPVRFIDNLCMWLCIWVLLLLQLALQPLVGFGLLYDFVPQSSIFTILSPVSHVRLLFSPLLLVQNISVLVSLLVLINTVPIHLIFFTVLFASILITCAAQHHMCCPTSHVLPNITCAAQHYMCRPTLHVPPIVIFVIL
jgi:hypothetical protein